MKASKRGWIKPTNAVLLGPKRIWNNPMTLRSNKVKKATLKRINKQWINQHRKSTKEYKKNSYF